MISTIECTKPESQTTLIMCEELRKLNKIDSIIPQPLLNVYVEISFILQVLIIKSVTMGNILVKDLLKLSLYGNHNLLWIWFARLPIMKNPSPLL